MGRFNIQIGLIMQSMTGYGNSHFILENISFQFRIRSFNNKHLESFFYLPIEFKWFEPYADYILKNRFQRGKIEIFLETSSELPKIPQFNVDIISQYNTLFKNFYKKKNIHIPMEVLIQIPGIVELRNKSWNEFKGKFEFYFLRALIRMEKTRVSEGKKLIQWTRKKIRLLSRMNQKIRILHREYDKTVKKNLQQKLVTILENAFSQSNIKKNESITKLPISFFKHLWMQSREDLLGQFQSDITEEMERIQIHLSAILILLNDKEPIGKKLEFYILEALREINTLTAKTQSSSINLLGIDMKVEIEKIREQIRNIE